MTTDNRLELLAWAEDNDKIEIEVGIRFCLKYNWKVFKFTFADKVKYTFKNFIDSKGGDHGQFIPNQYVDDELEAYEKLGKNVIKYYGILKACFV